MGQKAIIRQGGKAHHGQEYPIINGQFQQPAVVPDHQPGKKTNTGTKQYDLGSDDKPVMDPIPLGTRIIEPDVSRGPGVGIGIIHHRGKREQGVIDRGIKRQLELKGHFQRQGHREDANEVVCKKDKPYDDAVAV